MRFLPDVNAGASSQETGERTAGLDRPRPGHQGAQHLVLTILHAKAESAGREVIAGGPRNCPERGHTAKENRPAQRKFHCVACGPSPHADTVGALNVLRAGASRRQPGTATPAPRLQPGRSHSEEIEVEGQGQAAPVVVTLGGGLQHQDPRGRPTPQQRAAPPGTGAGTGTAAGCAPIRRRRLRPGG
ncbi:zinc ribbon domain-containing protein [Streptomyces phaeochromogenes]|uniref:zinc ribbon domain-containing protein n=1 Tax=Streptomyces phaeochromogenes TaxID=1923 RepID=UPI0027D7FD12|nr:zinc ribbon domain-containing protein [Streptomyces phaeochromogenes]